MKAIGAMLVSGALMLSASGVALAGSPNDAPQRAYDAGASNLGFCSAYLGQLGVRDDVNRIIVEQFPVSPGVIYRDRARQQENAPSPQEECVRRQ